MDAETGDTRSPLLPHPPPSQTQVTESPIPCALLLLLRISRFDLYPTLATVLVFCCCFAWPNEERKLETCCFLSPIHAFSPRFSPTAVSMMIFFLSLQVSSANQHYNKPFSWKAPAIILAFEFLESIAYSGIALNLVVYLGTVLHGTTASNAANVDAWNGATFLTPVLGAFLADTYWGKYKTAAISIIFYVVGLLIITTSAVIPSLRPASCEGGSCPPATGFQYFVLFGSLYLISIGTGGVKSALLPLGADQYNDANAEESKSKQLFFSWFFMAVNLGVFISGTVLVWIQQNVAWSLGFGISSICLVIAAVAFLVGTPLYRVQLPTGSPLKSIVMVFVASYKKRGVAVPADSTLLFEGNESSSIVPNKIEHTDEFR
uniref:Protein NRT1/ PTR FAMILY 8.3 n=1 Tax=Zea mays TaxID=4577 RepID=A0A804LP49_MAIZE